LKNPYRTSKKDEHDGALTAHIITNMGREITKSWRELAREHLVLKKSYEEMSRRHTASKATSEGKEIETKKKVKCNWTQSDMVLINKETSDKWTQSMSGPSKKDVYTQTQEENLERMEIVNEEGEGQVIQKLDKILIRVKKLEEGKDTIGSLRGVEAEDSTTWSKVIGRRKKARNIPTQEERDSRRHKNKEEEETSNKRKKNARTTLQAMKEKLPRGAGVLLELRGSTQEEYSKIFKNCQEHINLEELRIPPIGLRKARGGGILLEIRCNEQEEEKAKRLADCIKEVVGSVEGARVRCPLRRLKLKMVGLPFGATASEIAEAVAKSGGGDGRTRSGWARFGHRGPGRAPPGPTARDRWRCRQRRQVSSPSGGLEWGSPWREGGPPVPPLPGTWAPEAVVPLRG